MRVRLVRRPGQHGTKAYVDQHGDRLVCVRYRYDEAAKRRYKTIEIIVDEQPWEPKITAKTPVGIRIELSEQELRLQMKTIKAIWHPKLGVWQMPYSQAIALGLANRIVGTIAEMRAARASNSTRRSPR